MNDFFESIYVPIEKAFRYVWRPDLLPKPGIWLLTRFLFVPSFVYNLCYYGINKKRQWWNKIDDDVILGAVPCWFQFDQLEKLGVGAFVNMIDEFGHLFQWGEIEKRGLIELHLPTPDYISPSLSDVRKAIAFIENNASRGVVTYVHCKAGKGRAPTVVVCYLMKKHGFSPREAQDFIVKKRPQISKNLYKRQAVLEFQQILSEN